MVRTRPTVVLVMAILSIVLGSIWLLVSLCSGVFVLLFYNLQLPQAGGGTGNPMRELYDVWQEEVPGFVAIEISNFVLAIVLAVLVLVSGIGLLRMKTWARWTAVISSALAVIKEIAHFVFALLYVNPVMERWTQEFIRKQPPGTPDFSGNPVFNAIIGGGVLALSISFAVALLVVMFLPNVRAAFAGRSPSSLSGEKAHDDFGPDEQVTEDR